jgi:hypothetical protein
MPLIGRLPAAPLQRELAFRRGPGESWEHLAVRLGVCPRSLHRLMAASEIGATAADRWAIRLRLHPVLVWPNDWSRPKSRPPEPAKAGRDRCGASVGGTKSEGRWRADDGERPERREH